MSTSISSTVKELKELNEELKNLRATVKTCNARKKKCEADVLEYLDENSQPGVKYGNFVVLADTKTKRERKKKAQKELDGKAVLEKHGIQNSSEVLAEVIESMRGKQCEISTLKTKVG
jgi:hypothetical protein